MKYLQNGSYSKHDFPGRNLGSFSTLQTIVLQFAGVLLLLAYYYLLCVVQ